MRIGIGYDVHKFAKDRKLILGGIDIPFELGLLGHSDADVLTHAIIDAMFGALALGDIGTHFPDNDNKYKNIDSGILLKETKEIIISSGYKIINIDTNIIAQKPKLKEYIIDMRKNLSNTLDIDISQISIKATTEEALGFTGRLEGIKSQAVVLLDKI